jgi:uncharacterized protein YbjT (DUF2867 family)
MNARVVTVFGGTGFLGRRVVEHLRKHGFFVRIASRHADRGRELFGADASQFQFLEADIHDPQAVAEALAGAYGAVNAVSLYVEREGQTFHCVHVEAARRLAARARQDGLNGSSRCPESVPMQPRRRSTSASAGKASSRCGPPFPTRLSFVRRSCSGRMTRS